MLLFLTLKSLIQIAVVLTPPLLPSSTAQQESRHPQHHWIPSLPHQFELLSGVPSPFSNLLVPTCQDQFQHTRRDRHGCEHGEHWAWRCKTWVLNLSPVSMMSDLNNSFLLSGSLLLSTIWEDWTISEAPSSFNAVWFHRLQREHAHEQVSQN